MGLLDKLFPNNNNKTQQNAMISSYFETISAYTPQFTTYEGGLYEMDLTRSIIRAFARHCGKLKPEVMGGADTPLSRMLQTKPNPYQTTPQMLERLATIYETQNTAFIIPLEDKYGKITGIYPILPSSAELREYEGILWLVYQLGGKKAVIEYDRVGVIVQDQYRDDFWGESNRAMDTTMDMLHTQNEGIVEAIKQSAHIRFMAKVANVLKDKDLKAERDRFVANNLSTQESGGVMIFDQKYDEIKQVNSSPYVVDSNQLGLIRANAFNYFGSNEAILQNTYTSDQWNAYYEGKIEPFAIKVSIALSQMFFTERERAFGNGIILTANRLQYLSNEEKLATVTSLFDRGMLMVDEGLEIFNMNALPDGEGQKRFIRKEYIEYNELTKEEEASGEIPLEPLDEPEDPPAEDPAPEQDQTEEDEKNDE